MTENQKQFVEHLFGEARGKPKLAKELAGYAESVSASTIMKSEEVQEEIKKRTGQLIASTAPESVFAMLDVLSGKEILGAKEKMAAAKDLLDRGGYAKTDKVEVTTKSPLFVLPPKENRDVDDEDMETS